MNNNNNNKKNNKYNNKKSNPSFKNKFENNNILTKDYILEVGNVIFNELKNKNINNEFQKYDYCFNGNVRKPILKIPDNLDYEDAFLLFNNLDENIQYEKIRNFTSEFNLKKKINEELSNEFNLDDEEIPDWYEDEEMDEDEFKNIVNNTNLFDNSNKEDNSLYCKEMENNINKLLNRNNLMDDLKLFEKEIKQNNNKFKKVELNEIEKIKNAEKKNDNNKENNKENNNEDIIDDNKENSKEDEDSNSELSESSSEEVSLQEEKKFNEILDIFNKNNIKIDVKNKNEKKVDKLKINKENILNDLEKEKDSENINKKLEIIDKNVLENKDETHNIRQNNELEKLKNNQPDKIIINSNDENKEEIIKNNQINNNNQLSKEELIKLKKIKKEQFIIKYSYLDNIICSFAYDTINSRNLSKINNHSIVGINIENITIYTSHSYKIFSYYVQGKIFDRFWYYKDELQIVQGPLMSFDMDIYNIKGNVFNNNTMISPDNVNFLPYELYQDRELIAITTIQNYLNKLENHHHSKNNYHNKNNKKNSFKNNKKNNNKIDNGKKNNNKIDNGKKNNNQKNSNNKDYNKKIDENRTNDLKLLLGINKNKDFNNFNNFLTK